MDESWLQVLGDELERPSMQGLRAFLVSEVAAGRGFYPPADRVFNALLTDEQRRTAPPVDTTAAVPDTCKRHTGRDLAVAA